MIARRYLRNEAKSNTLQTTALVHEVYLRLVDAARARGSDKRGGRAVKVNIEETAILSPAPNPSLLALDEALTVFSEVAPRQAKVVELRYFGGLTEEEIVAVLKISARTVRRDWDLAKAWLSRELKHTIKEP